MPKAHNKGGRPSLLRQVLLIWVVASGTAMVAKFPYHFDLQSEPAAKAAARADEVARPFYDKIYEARPAAATATATATADSDYVEMAKVAVHALDVHDKIRAFVKRFHLEDKRILDVGAGSGYLQDEVADYTGLDIAPEAARFFHKKYVVGSATALPFPDASFDAVWSIWVLEHVPNPEKALSEMRRVVKPGGYIYLWPAWDCPSWAGEGYEVRPYSDFGISGKLIKASIPIRRSGILDGLYVGPVRLMRLATARWFGPTRFRYQLLKANYEKYWTTDSDAVNSMDPYEAYLWYTSRGDACMNCKPAIDMIYEPPYALIFRVDKPAASR
jgi:SAM-dependent methyltransferase